MENNAKNLKTELADDQLDQVVGGETTVPIVQSMDYKKCPYCGQRYNTIYDSCPTCHSPRVCSRCKAVYLAGLICCPKCGTAFHAYRNDVERFEIHGRYQQKQVG